MITIIQNGEIIRMNWTQEMHKYQENRHLETLTRAERHAQREFWHGFAWAAVLHWCAIGLVVVILAPAIRQAIEYAGQVATIQAAVNNLPMVEK